MQLDEFTKAYIECALWAEADDNGQPLDERFNASNLAPEILAQMRADCQAFQEEAGVLLAQSGLSMPQAGHDFWLTRNRHGAGFWDRGLGPLGEKLSAIARVYGSLSFYGGDDGRLYLS